MRASRIRNFKPTDGLSLYSIFRKRQELSDLDIAELRLLLTAWEHAARALDLVPLRGAFCCIRQMPRFRKAA
jgi:hypothetical protein